MSHCSFCNTETIDDEFLFTHGEAHEICFDCRCLVSPLSGGATLRQLQIMLAPETTDAGRTAMAHQISTRFKWLKPEIPAALQNAMRDCEDLSHDPLVVFYMQLAVASACDGWEGNERHFCYHPQRDEHIELQRPAYRYPVR